MATTENTGGSRVATVLHVAPASPEPKRSPEVAPSAVYRHTTAARPYAYWLFGSPVAWALMLGLPTATLALRALAKGDPAAIALVAIVITSSILGLTKGETERILAPLRPLAASPPPQRCRANDSSRSSRR